MPHQSLSPELLALLREHAPAGTIITTIAAGHPNLVTAVDEDGVRIETRASKEKGTGAQLVPAWMIETGWDHLRRNGFLENSDLLSRLKVKRSSAVCALLATLPPVRVASSRPIRLEFVR